MSAQKPKKAPGLTPLGWGCLIILLIIILGTVTILFLRPWELLPKPTQAAIPTKESPTQPETKPTPTPIINTQSQVGSVTEPTPTPFQPSTSWPPDPENDPRPTLVCAFNTFGSYLNCVVMQGMDNPSRPYRLVLKPYNFETSTGELLNPAEEVDQANQITSGEEVDILLNTPDFLTTYQTGARIITKIDRSHGADLMAMRMKGVTSTCVDSNGQPKELKIFNDLEHCIIAVAGKSVGQRLVLSFMQIADMTSADVTVKEYPTVEDAVEGYMKGETDAVAGWTGTLAMDRVWETDSIEILSTRWLNTIDDDIIVSTNANNNKEELVFNFLVDWFKALKLQQEQPEVAAQMISDWRYNGEATNTWTGVFPDNPVKDLESLLKDQIAQAPLKSNLELYDNLEVEYEHLIDIREAWRYGGIPLYEPFTASDLVEPKYMVRMKEYLNIHPELLPQSGELFDPSYTVFRPSTNPPNKDQLIELPTVVQFGCSQYNYEAGVTDIKSGTSEYDAFLECAKSLKRLVMASDSDLLITGSAARPTWYTLERSESVAKARAYTFFEALHAAGIPYDHMAVQYLVGPASDDEAVRQASRFVKVEVKRSLAYVLQFVVGMIFPR